MSTNYNPQIVTSGLILALDTANPKSYSYSENLVPNSNTFFGFTISNITSVLNSNTAPDGTLSAVQMREDANTTPHSFNITTGVTANSMFLPYTASIYAKANSRTCFGMAIKEYSSFIQQAYANFDVANNVILTTYAYNGAVLNNASITPVGNGWSRCVLTVTPNSANSFIGFENRLLANTVVGAQQFVFTYTGDGVSNMHFWGPQLQQSSNVSPFILTTNTAIQKSNTITDLSLSKNSGTLINLNEYSVGNGTIYLTGNSFFGLANVSNSNITLSSSMPSPLNSMTAEVWVRPTSTGSTYIFGQTNSIWRLMQFGTSAFGFVCATSNNAWYSAGTAVTGVTSVTLGSWYQVVAVYDGTQVMLYYNGKFEATGGATLSGTVANNVVNTYTTLSVGKTDASNLDNFQGQIGIVKLYNRALSNNEILQNFNATRGRYNL
jgi:hypothetical protein